MDDLLTGAPTIEEATQLQKEIHDVLQSAKFMLRKYQSNSIHVLAKIDQSLVETKLNKDISSKGAVAVLGLQWVPDDDTFVINLPELQCLSSPITKRRMLSEVAKVFDPLGFVAPITIQEKLMIQQLWQQGINWDDEIPSELSSQYVTFRKELSLLSKFSIPRPYYSQRPERLNLIGFCDASQKAYCAILYVQAIKDSQVESVRFVCAKTRVSPLKAVTIPKLELCAAVLLAELAHRVHKILKIKLSNVFAFSDSKVVISWLAKPPEMWKTHVENRVRRIINLVPFTQWGHVSSTENPADLATHECSVKSFLKSDWFKGPSFLYGPNIVLNASNLETELEKRRIGASCNLVANLHDSEDFEHSFMKRFSDFSHLLRIHAYILCYFQNLKTLASSTSSNKLNKTVRPFCLTSDDLKRSFDSLIRKTQKLYYPKDYLHLIEGKPISKNSILKSHNPFLDPNKIIRLATRLSNAPFLYDKRNPVVLPANSYLVLLLIRQVHTTYYHATRSFVCTYLCSRYQFTGGIKRVIKKEIRQCILCLRYQAETKGQIMGDLPANRCTISHPFALVGVDLAGPFLCKPMLPRSRVQLKLYACIFVCFTTHAVHIESVLSLSAEEFLNALHWFVSCRGIPNVIHSDNGSNFQAASKYFDFRQETIQNSTANNGISWKFNPPRAPHRGGLWESVVKSMKYHLNRTTKGQILRYDEYNTIFTRIEAIMNSRPLCYKVETSTPEDLVLTPGHFLIGDQITSVAEPESSPVPLTKRYELMQRQTQLFWNAWSKDYLAQLRTRTKWHKAQPNVSKGQLVLLKDNLHKPAHLEMGIIDDVFPDSKGLIRTVAVRNKGTLKKRDIRSLVPLPTGDP